VGFEPPPGYTDLLADADITPPCGGYEPLSVPAVATVAARRPAPRAAAALAMSANRRLPAERSAGHLIRFVTDHLADDDYERLLDAMMEGRAPHDTVGRVARAVATWGTARPYLAVATLAAVTAQHWRLVRNHLIDHGIPDPLTRLPSLHALLDVTEHIVLESFSGEKPAEAKRRRTAFLNSLYAPERPERVATPVNGETYRPRPPGFSDDEVEAAFDTFARTVGR